MSVHKQGKKNRKHGRNQKKCQLYRGSKKREYAKYKKILRYNTEQAIEYARLHGLSL